MNLRNILVATILILGLEINLGGFDFLDYSRLFYSGARRIRGSLKDNPGLEGIVVKIELALAGEDKAQIRTLIQANAMLNQMKSWTKALEHLSQADWKARVYIAIAITYNLYLGDYNKSIEFNLKAAEEFFNLKIFKEAAESFKSAAIISKINLGDYYEKVVNDHRKAVGYYRQAVEYNARAGDCYTKAEKFEEAGESFHYAGVISAEDLQDFVKAVEYHGKAGDSYNKAGGILFKEAGKMYSIAGNMSRVQLGDFTNAVTYYIQAGKAYERAGRFEKAAFEEAAKVFIKAAEVLEYGLRLYEKAAQYYFQAGRMYEEAGMGIEAKECYDKAEELSKR